MAEKAPEQGSSFGKEEFTGKNIAKALGRSALLFLAIVLSFFAVVHWAIGVVAIALLAWGISMSLKDTSKLKWVNVFLRIVFMLIALLFIIQGIRYN